MAEVEKDYQRKNRAERLVSASISRYGGMSDTSLTRTGRQNAVRVRENMMLKRDDGGDEA